MRTRSSYFLQKTRRLSWPVAVLASCCLSHQLVYGSPAGTAVRETCRKINPAECRAVNTGKPNDRDWHIMDFSNPQKPLDILHFHKSDSLQCVAAINWLKQYRITEQCVLGSFAEPLLFYYRTEGKAPVTRCRENGFIKEEEGFIKKEENGLMGNYLLTGDYSKNGPLCDSLPQLSFSRENISYRYYAETGVGVSFYKGVFYQVWAPEQLDRFFYLVDKYRWNRMGMFYQSRFPLNRGHGSPDSPFFMRYEPDTD